ncbi:MULTISPECIES: hypothetical protein [Prauserella salsuginis group]|uniref:Uncharacterized protein n=2 Tax=Prauserella salsuginis group TaxID=2893672 RepID=A0A839XRI7_9PSEU|nr:MULTISPECIES: hypothetical protein [Prauserella salsuginis group]MBB3666402.1 hypothetical protein [Prauserella sediminis]MCR3719140.1 hypothetical protein [Prauserella flava]MCR3735847.1 hypothetical protein [Prauserella salsuginis]
MADQLATAEDLRTLLGEDATGLTTAEAELLLQLATGAVQAAAGQSILQATETVAVMGTVESWLSLPNRPVTDVSSVTLDGAEVSDHKRFGDRLWRARGWAASAYEPSTVEVTYTHGYLTTDAGAQLARSATLMVAAQMFSNPSSAGGFSIDDYQEQGTPNSDMAGMVPQRLQQALRRQYGPGARMVKIG